MTVVDAPDAAAPVTVGEMLGTDRGPMFALRAGHGRTILCLHGVTANAYVWEPVVRRLADRFAVVALDQRGHGRTGLLGADPLALPTWSAAEYADDALAAARAVGEWPVLLVGHSLGARNALAAAVRDPGAVAGVVAIDFTPFIEARVFDALDERVARGGAAVPDLDAARAALRERYPNLPEGAIERRARHGFRDDGDGWAPLADPGAVVSTCTGLRADLETTLRSVSVPVLLLRGRDSTLVSAEAWQATSELRPDIDALEVDGADHYVVEERPDATAELIAWFASERARWDRRSDTSETGADVGKGSEPWQSR